MTSISVTLTSHQERVYTALAGMVDSKTNTFRGRFESVGYVVQNPLLPLKALEGKGLIKVKKLGRVPPSKGRRGSIIEAQLLIPPEQVQISVYSKAGGASRCMYEATEGEEYEEPLKDADQSMDLWERHWARICGDARFEDDPRAGKPEVAFRAPRPATWAPRAA